jgi:hypothetical protein
MNYCTKIATETQQERCERLAEIFDHIQRNSSWADHRYPAADPAFKFSVAKYRETIELLEVE